MKGNAELCVTWMVRRVATNSTLSFLREDGVRALGMYCDEMMQKARRSRSGRSGGLSD